MKKYLIKWLFPNYKEELRTKIIKELYGNPEMLTEIELVNKTKKLKCIWCEISCIEILLDDKCDYKIVTHDKSFCIEFTGENEITLFFNYSFGFKLYKRTKNNNQWELDEDYSEIN